jgi:hypothetical protein
MLMALGNTTRFTREAPLACTACLSFSKLIALHNFCDYSDCYDVLACCFVGWRLCALTHVLCANAHPHAYVTYSGPRQQLPPDMPCGRGNELRARRHFRPGREKSASATRSAGSGARIGTRRAVTAASSWSYAAETSFCSTGPRQMTSRMGPWIRSQAQGRKACHRGPRDAECRFSIACVLVCVRTWLVPVLEELEERAGLGLLSCILSSGTDACVCSV